jgi:hypothetical protein
MRMMMPIATLTDLKALLGIPAAETSKDVALAAVLAAAESWALQLTGHSLAAELARVDILESTRLGFPVFLTRRPVSAITSVKGRAYGETDLRDLKYDLTDATKGRVVILGSDFVGFYGGLFGSGLYNPERLRPHPYFRWREVIYPVIQITYNVAEFQAPAEYKQAVMAIAGSMYTQHAKAGLKSLSVGNISESYGEMAAVDPGAVALLTPYLRGLARVVH